MPDINLVLNLPSGVAAATSLGLSGLAWHQKAGHSWLPHEIARTFERTN